MQLRLALAVAPAGDWPPRSSGRCMIKQEILDAARPARGQLAAHHRRPAPRDPRRPRRGRGNAAVQPGPAHVAPTCSIAQTQLADAQSAEIAAITRIPDRPGRHRLRHRHTSRRRRACNWAPTSLGQRPGERRDKNRVMAAENGAKAVQNLPPIARRTPPTNLPARTLSLMCDRAWLQ